MKNYLLDFNNKLFQQTSGTTIATKSTPPYACIYVDKVEQEFWKYKNYCHCCGSDYMERKD